MNMQETATRARAVDSLLNFETVTVDLGGSFVRFGDVEECAWGRWG